MTINTAILGGSGYTGLDLIKIILNHPHAKIAYISADKNAGKNIGEVHKSLTCFDLPKFVAANDIDYNSVDLVFCCLPHAVSQAVVKGLPEHLKVIDLSADYRLNDIKSYNEWYGHEHCAPELQKKAVYGIAELAREQIRKARLIANPGCYPTSAILPLWPLLRDKAIQLDGIIIDAKSGTSGAGRTLKENLLYCEVNETFSVYGIPRHRHMPEIEQELSKAAGTAVQVTFSPHLVAMQRGILSTIYVRLQPGVALTDLRGVLERQYAGEAFVKILPDGAYPSTALVAGTNFCAINVFEGRRKGEAVIVSVIDNLIKGASGQAVQNMNIMHNLPEATGFKLTPSHRY